MIDLALRVYDWLKEKTGSRVNHLVFLAVIFIAGWVGSTLKTEILEVKKTLVTVQDTQIKQAQVEENIQHSVDKVARATDEISVVLINKFNVSLPVGILNPTNVFAYGSNYPLFYPAP